MTLKLLDKCKKLLGKLASITNTLALYKLFLGGNLSNIFCISSDIVIADVLGLKQYLGMISEDLFLVDLNRYLVNNCVLVSNSILSYCLDEVNSVNKCLLKSELSFFFVYTDSLDKELGTVSTHGGAIAYFLDIDNDIRVEVHDLFSLTLAKLQAITLILDCVPVFSSVILFMDSQAFLDICVLFRKNMGPNFHDKCWLKKKHIY
ncbi:hypothetical protein G9A89_018110 [Geosiphon pyriformis]|nr:hypothetical protein G9A89_018110 [Geosiphon pyriformis]